ncbi:MAG: bifunctional oligoribonuclease/PAP phosphatase NrnA [Phycisphaerae bacterium]|nr:bifunctional oligoribonuclease/PAP phosphatase NrnA [Phycisphaerae bacterium]
MDFQKAVNLINENQRILLTTHRRPDGDACGSIAALSEALLRNGKDVKVLFLSPIPQWYQFLFTDKPVVLDENLTAEQLANGQFYKPDLIIICDTNSRSQLEGGIEFIDKSGAKILVIDHHVTSDNLGDVEVVDAAAAAAGIIVFELLKDAGWDITEGMAEALFAAVATDTGWFQFANTDARTHRVCAELIEKGANPTNIYKKFYQNFSPQRFLLMRTMFDNMTLHFDNRYAEQFLCKVDFDRTGAAYSDTENFIDQCRQIQSVEVAAFFVELPDGRINVSLRSSGTIDVREIAQKYGGGGHKQAAGVRIRGTIEDVMKTIRDEIKERL